MLGLALGSAQAEEMGFALAAVVLSGFGSVVGVLLVLVAVAVGS